MLKLDLEYIKGILFIRLKGELTRKTSYKLNNYLIPIIKAYGIKYIVYNLYELKKLDENGITSLKKSALAILNNHGIIYLCEIPINLEKKLNSVFFTKVLNETKAIELCNL